MMVALASISCSANLLSLFACLFPSSSSLSWWSASSSFYSSFFVACLGFDIYNIVFATSPSSPLSFTLSSASSFSPTSPPLCLSSAAASFPSSLLKSDRLFSFRQYVQTMCTSELHVFVTIISFSPSFFRFHHHHRYPRRRNVTTLIVGLKNGHIRKNLTQKW